MPRRPKVKRPLTIADLPALSTDRWVIRRKAEVLAAVHGGLVRWKTCAGATCSRLKSFSPGNIRSIATAWPGFAPRASSNTGLVIFRCGPCPVDKGESEREPSPAFELSGRLKN
jgi:hypothetical protein